MGPSSFLRSSKVRRSIAVFSVILSAGGLVLMRAPASASQASLFSIESGGAAATFGQGPIHGAVTLSQSAVVGGVPTELFADVKLSADKQEGVERAPLSLAVVLDTSGSMAGDKIEDAKRSVLRLLADMRDDDEIALIRYSDAAEILQPLARVGEVRRGLESRVRELQAAGGTNIPGGLREGRGSLTNAGLGRVKRIVLVSDGLDSGRSSATALASDAAEHGMTVSSLGVGTDFDESYMGEIARQGHGNFAFVKEGEALATFLRKELTETASTVAQNLHVRITLPEGVSFVRAHGAEARIVGNNTVDLSAGALFSGDERRVTLELSSSLQPGMRAPMPVTASWMVRDGSPVAAEASGLALAAVSSRSEADASRNAEVYARAMSVLASRAQTDAAEAFAKGDRAKAQALIDDNLQRLEAAAVSAPAAAPALRAQARAYESDKNDFGGSDPFSGSGKAAAKKASAREFSNSGRVLSY